MKGIDNLVNSLKGKKKVQDRIREKTSVWTHNRLDFTFLSLLCFHPKMGQWMYKNYYIDESLNIARVETIIENKEVYHRRKWLNPDWTCAFKLSKFKNSTQ